jgi:histidinol-phosphate aminotransferase
MAGEAHTMDGFHQIAPPLVPAPIPELVGISPYSTGIVAGLPGLHLEESIGVAPSSDLSLALSAIRSDALHSYPDSHTLRARIAHRHAVDPDRVILCAGTDEALLRVCRAYLDHTRNAVLPCPTFEMLVRYARLSGAVLNECPWVADPLPVNQMLAHVGPRTGVIALVSPNNPTGLVATEQDLRAIAEHASHAVVILDHAYVEYADVDLTGIGLNYPNVVVMRSFSKAWGMAGLRLGYALGHPSIIRAMGAVGPAYPVSGVSLAVLEALLDHGDAVMHDHVALVRRERDELTALLREMGVPVLPSQGNFVLAPMANAAQVHVRLAEAGVFVRHIHQAGTLGPALRIGCPASPGGMRLLTRALREVLGGRSA